MLMFNIRLKRKINYYSNSNDNNNSNSKIISIVLPMK